MNMDWLGLTAEEVEILGMWCVLGLAFLVEVGIWARSRGVRR